MASDKLYEIQSIIDESKETLSSELYNKLSLACKKSFDEKKTEKLFVKVKIMFFAISKIQENNIIIPKFRHEVIPLSPHQNRILLERNIEGKFTPYRSLYCTDEQTEHVFSEQVSCQNCDCSDERIFQVYTGEYIVHTYRALGVSGNWLSSHTNPYKKINDVELPIPNDEQE
jgi:hypothetical protein